MQYIRRNLYMANTKVEFKVSAPLDVEAVYVCGSVKGLGDWDVKKAVELKKCPECGKFVVTKMLPLGETVEFKVLADKTWDAIEKGSAGEELTNHSFIAEKGLVVEVEVSKFN